MEPQRCEKDDDLVQVMQRLAAGDEAAVVTLYERYGSSIAAAVRHVARSRPGRLDDDDVGGAVLDVCFELARVAGGWSPAGGALPWVWARHRVAGAVDRALGQQAQSLDDQRTEVLDRLAVGAAPGPSTAEPSLLDTLERLAAQAPATRLRPGTDACRRRHGVGRPQLRRPRARRPQVRGPRVRRFARRPPARRSRSWRPAGLRSARRLPVRRSAPRPPVPGRPGWRRMALRCTVPAGTAWRRSGRQRTLCGRRFRPVPVALR